ncbi:hypothetical protein [Methylomagnum ishizawai]|uniref:hypothetical protein n=1 Tax=Methylomagnum ishizawai TaxID=1760988 RepID=UPI001C325C82|nr:hypothetical protein [Methylomagnum ishizawai]BBL73106.1 hypothetical protein MishRS11D_02040 [Methylomagnum ishizawai]
MNPPQPFLFRALNFALPLALLAGCASQPHQTLPTEYRRDAQNCRAQSAKHVEVRMNMAGIATQELDGGMDEDQYLACMQKLGWKQDESTDPLLKAIAKCQAQSERPLQATPETGGTKLSGSLDRNAFRQCLKQRGFEGDVTIGPVTPANPQ